MSLQVWLPLNGNLENYGLNNMTFSYIQNNGALSDNNNGKIGKCYERTASAKNDLIRSSTTIDLSGDISMACWAYVTNTIGDTANGLVTNHSHTDNTGVGITVKQVSTSDYRISCNTGTGSSRTYRTYYGTTNIKNAWHHLTLTYNKSKKQLLLWVDGVIEYTLNNYTNASKSDYIDIFNWSTTNYTSGNYRPICKLNDIRIYDHCLSLKEVKELSKGLCLHYQLKDEIGVFPKIYDASGYLNNGIIAGSIVNDTDTPRYQRCYKFTPTSYIGIPNQPLNSSLTDFTFCFWMKTSSPKATMCLWNGRNNTGTALGIFALGGTFRYDDGSQRSMTNYSIPINEWHYYVFARDSSNIKFYVDGELKQTVSSSPFSDIGTNATIGASSINTTTGSGNAFSGLLLDYRIYTTTLSDSDVLELYKTSFQIDNNGNSYSYELIEQE